MVKPDDLPGQKLPQNRVIRRRFAARTTSIHVCALPPELKSLASLADADGYLLKHRIPEQNQVYDEEGALLLLTRDEAWKFFESNSEEMESKQLSGRAGEIAASISNFGQGIYANFGRPPLDFSVFFRDYHETTAEASRALSRSGKAVTPINRLHIAPIFFVWDTLSAAGLTALGHFARGAPMRDRSVVTDVVSTGVYEGASVYATAKLGLLAGSRAMVTMARLPIPGAHAAAFITGFMTGLIVAVSGKTLVNFVKNATVDNALQEPQSSRQAGEITTTNAIDQQSQAETPASSEITRQTPNPRPPLTSGG